MKRVKTLYEDTVPCDCGRVKYPKLFNVEGFKVRGWQCKKCGEIEYSDDIDKVLTFRKLQKTPIPVKAREIGHSEVMTIPKPIATLMSIKKGDKLLIRPESMNKFEARVEG